MWHIDISSSIDLNVEPTWENMVILLNLKLKLKYVLVLYTKPLLPPLQDDWTSSPNTV